MKEFEAKDFLFKADEHFLTAMNLYAMFIQESYPYHKFDPLSKIANYCELSGELYLKSYMKENSIEYDNNHRLFKHLGNCKQKDNSFSFLDKDVSILSNYTSIVNYPNEISLTKSNIDKCIMAAKNILLFPEMMVLRQKYDISLPLQRQELANIINDCNNQTQKQMLEYCLQQMN